MEIDTLSVMGNAPPRSVNASFPPALYQAIISCNYPLYCRQGPVFAFSFTALHLKSRWVFKKEKSKLVSIFWCSCTLHIHVPLNRSVASLAINYSHSVNSHSRRVRRKRHLFCSISITPPTISGSQGNNFALALGPGRGVVELLIFRWFVLAHATCLVWVCLLLFWRCRLLVT